MTGRAALAVTAAGFAAGWMARNAVGHRRRARRTPRPGLASVLGADAWALNVLAAVKHQMDAADRVENVTVLVRAQDGTALVFGMEEGAREPVRVMAAEGPEGTAWQAYEVPDSPEGLEER